MTRHDCDICRGAGFIRLPVRQRLSVRMFAPESNTLPIEATSRDFPCPECAGTVTEDRVRLLTASTEIDSRYHKAELIGHAKQDIATKIATTMLDDGLIDFVLEDRPYDLVLRVAGIVGVVSKKFVESLDQRVKARQFGVAQRLIQDAAKAIRIWNSHYSGDEGAISKNQAVASVEGAFLDLRSRLEKETTMAVD